MSRDLRDALDVLEKEKNISKDTPVSYTHLTLPTIA